MNIINRLTQLIADADEAYKQSIIAILNEIVPDLDVDLSKKSLKRFVGINTEVVALMKSY